MNMPTPPTDLEKLQAALDKLVDVYKSRVLTPGFDNSLLDELHSAIKFVELAIRNIE